ncbi:MAG: hypothetical protein JWO48_3688 [Bryobacterales bacterium]|jgi:toxin-antitoxin system PIN domain toxin|nr:hypothetical protein [Bryobacterales bacterium]
MSAFLLDVNVLIALIWPAHAFHANVHTWFSRHSRRGWATCPISQAGFVRVVSNPSFSRDAVSPEEALSLLADNLQRPSHQFWADEIGIDEATLPFRQRVVGHQQITDAYLLGLAMHHKAKLATLDRSVVALLADDVSAAGCLEVIDT